MCVCRVWYPTCNVHAPYCHLCPAWLQNIFPFDLINNTIFEKKKIVFNIKCVFNFSTTFAWQMSNSKNCARYDQKRIFVFKYSARYSCPILTNLDFSRHIFLKILKYQISWKSVQWEPSCSMQTGQQTDVWTDGETGRPNEANSRFSQFCETSKNNVNFLTTVNQKTCICVWVWKASYLCSSVRHLRCTRNAIGVSPVRRARAA